MSKSNRRAARATLPAAPYADHPHTTQYTVDCRYGTTTCIVVQEPDAASVSSAQFITLAIINLSLEEGCDCAAGLYARYGVRFAAERGIELPPFRSLRQNVAVWLASKAVRV